ncbi:hypothetical protein [Bizionia paragorgiae]|nr:hypothetical protein [Bizionia paragorgiae]
MTRSTKTKPLENTPHLIGTQRKLSKMQKQIPRVLIGILIAAFILPFTPSRRGGDGLLTYIDYHYLVIITFILLLLFYAIGYHITKDRYKTKLLKATQKRQRADNNEAIKD